MSEEELECVILCAIDELYSEVRQHWGENSDTATQFDVVTATGSRYSRPSTAKSFKSFDSRKSRQSLLSSGSHKSRQTKKSIFDTDIKKRPRVGEGELRSERRLLKRVADAVNTRAIIPKDNTQKTSGIEALLCEPDVET